MCVDSNFPKPIPKMFSSVIVIPNSYFESMQRGIEFVNVCTNFESVETQAITIPGASASIKCRSRPPGAAGRPPGPRGQRPRRRGAPCEDPGGGLDVGLPCDQSPRRTLRSGRALREPRGSVRFYACSDSKLERIVFLTPNFPFSP